MAELKQEAKWAYTANLSCWLHGLEDILKF